MLGVFREHWKWWRESEEVKKVYLEWWCCVGWILWWEPHFQREKQLGANGAVSITGEDNTNVEKQKPIFNSNRHQQLPQTWLLPLVTSHLQSFPSLYSFFLFLLHFVPSVPRKPVVSMQRIKLSGQK